MRSNTFEQKANTTKNPDKPNSEKDFDTYSVQGKMSYQKQPPNTNNPPSNNQKMTKSIMESLKKLYKDNDKNICLANFKPTQKTLLSTIATFLNAIDSTFTQNQLTVQMIPEIYKALDYPNTISKTYFQPVGAPHTWAQCLAMMEWLGDLATFHSEIRAFQEEADWSDQQDFSRVLLDAYLENNPNIVKKSLQDQMLKKEKEIESLKYHISTMNMEMQNQMNAQKSMNEMANEESALAQIIYRETQECIQLRNQNSQLEKTSNNLKNQCSQQAMISSVRSTEIESLTKEVENQEHSVEEVQRFGYQIQELRQKINQIKKYEDREKETLDKTDDAIINEFLDFNKTFEALRHMYRKHKYEMDVRNIYIEVPECDVIKFREFLKNRTEDCTDMAVTEIFKINQIKEIQKKFDALFNLVKQEMKSLDDSNQQISGQTQVIRNQTTQKEMQKTDQDIKLDTMKSKLNQINYEFQNLQNVINNLTNLNKTLESDIQVLKDKEISLIEEAEQFLREVNQLIELSKVFKPDGDEAVEEMAEHHFGLKSEMLEKVCELTGIIQEFNEDMGMMVMEGDQRVEGGNEEMAEGEGERMKIEEVRRDHVQREEDYDYLKILGEQAYQSPKVKRLGRKQNWYKEF